MLHRRLTAAVGVLLAVALIVPRVADADGRAALSGTGIAAFGLIAAFFGSHAPGFAFLPVPPVVYIPSPPAGFISPSRDRR
ncbi:MAG: hypothetical protein HY060_10285 [Proteobacteria bacterium]|nr:hypothetical protein [Pseudomonadota bacterium]